MKILTRFLAILLLLCAALAAGGPGFRSKQMLEAHFAKHGDEFGRISMQDYLSMAQELRDAPLGGDVVEAIREDRVITRFHKKKGWFGAYNMDRTIRTFFIPVDGERYFLRQARRPKR